MAAALAQLVVAAALIAAFEIILEQHSATHPHWAGMAYSVVGAEFVAIGALTWLRRPQNGTGLLLGWCGLAFLAAAAVHTRPVGLEAIGLIVAWVNVGIVIHLVLAFPTGRLPDRPSRWLAAAGYAVTVGAPTLIYLFAPATDVPLLHIRASERVANDTLLASNFGLLGVAIGTAVVTVGRIRRAGTGFRGPIVSVSAYGVFAILIVAGSTHLHSWLDIGVNTVFVIQVVALAGVPIVIAVAIARGGFARTAEIEELAEWLAASTDRPNLTTLIGRALGDPSVRILYWSPDATAFIDESGHPAGVAQPSRARADVTLRENRIGAIEYDATLVSEQTLVTATSAMIAVDVDRERLNADLRATEMALRDSRARILTAGDRERRRLAADLHDGLQGQLVTIALQLGELSTGADVAPATRATADAIRSRLDAVMTDLRHLLHGLMPAILVEHGLVPAIREFLDGIPIAEPLRVSAASGSMRSLPQPVESAAYFVVAEAVTNAVKHSQARTIGVHVDADDVRVNIRVHDDGVGGAAPRNGGGLRSLADRLEALGGKITIDSQPSGGTSVSARIPRGELPEVEQVDVRAARRTPELTTDAEIRGPARWSG